MAQLAPAVTALAQTARDRLVIEALNAVGPDPEPLRPIVLFGPAGVRPRPDTARMSAGAEAVSRTGALGG